MLPEICIFLEAYPVKDFGFKLLIFSHHSIRTSSTWKADVPGVDPEKDMLSDCDNFSLSSFDHRRHTLKICTYFKYCWVLQVLQENIKVILTFFTCSKLSGSKQMMQCLEIYRITIRNVMLPEFTYFQHCCKIRHCNKIHYHNKIFHLHM